MNDVMNAISPDEHLAFLQTSDDPTTQAVYADRLLDAGEDNLSLLIRGQLALYQEQNELDWLTIRATHGKARLLTVDVHNAIDYLYLGLKFTSLSKEDFALLLDEKPHLTEQLAPINRDREKLVSQTWNKLMEEWVARVNANSLSTAYFEVTKKGSIWGEMRLSTVALPAFKDFLKSLIL